MLEKLNSESGSPIIEIKLIISTTMHIINKSKDLSKIAWELMPMIGLKVQYINFPFVSTILFYFKSRQMNLWDWFDRFFFFSRS